MNLRSTCDHKADLIAQAQTYLLELRQATQAARERVYAGVAPPFAHVPGAAPDLPQEVVPPVREAGDAIFATRRFDVPEPVIDALDRYDQTIGD
ncbi:MAG: hypothetical protein ABR508_07620 [Candidatus Baltobacteraceae bacterium]